MSQYNNDRTRAFDVVDNKTNGTRRKVVLAIFVVVVLILAAFATLIIGKIVSQLPEKDPVISKHDMTHVPKEPADVNVGHLLLINDEFSYVIPSDLSNMIKIYDYRRNPDNVSSVEINGKYTYSLLSSNKIVLDKDVLDAWNNMLLDYCSSIDISSANSNCASNIVVGWGGYTQSNLDEYTSDLLDDEVGPEYYDHILGTTVALRVYDPSTSLNEDMLKNDFSWIYENAHKYGFILRHPNACKNHTGFGDLKRVHLRYIGVEHATYIYQNNICFEKYLEILRNQHSSYENALKVEVEGTTYLTYYVKSTGNPTSIPVPKNCEYTISGDNMNGFIVTVKK